MILTDEEKECAFLEIGEIEKSVGVLECQKPLLVLLEDHREEFSPRGRSLHS